MSINPTPIGVVREYSSTFQYFWSKNEMLDIVHKPGISKQPRELFPGRGRLCHVYRSTWSWKGESTELLRAQEKVVGHTEYKPGSLLIMTLKIVIALKGRTEYFSRFFPTTVFSWALASIIMWFGHESGINVSSTLCFPHLLQNCPVLRSFRIC